MIFSAVLSLAVLQSQTIDAYVQRGFEDATVTARVKSGNQRELSKINRDFGLSYRFAYSNIQVKEPFRFRAESILDDAKLIVIQNGFIQKFDTPIYKGKQNLAKAPGRVRSIIEFGILTPSLFTDFFTAKFVRVDRASGDVVFDFTYVPERNDKSRFRVWIDPEKKYTTKREWYGGQGDLRATFYYEKPVKIDGVWAPTFGYVKNADNVMAGSISYENLRINKGLPDSLFVIK